MKKRIVFYSALAVLCWMVIQASAECDTAKLKERPVNAREPKQILTPAKPRIVYAREPKVIPPRVKKDCEVLVEPIKPIEPLPPVKLIPGTYTPDQCNEYNRKHSDYRRLYAVYLKELSKYHEKLVHYNHSGGGDDTNPGGHGNENGFENPNNKKK